jgi:acetolactate synthase-1/2/3 large subunit
LTEHRLGDVFLDYLLEKGYTHCFFLAGGNIMHLLNGVRLRFQAVPFVHEGSAMIAAEYFNKVSGDSQKAFVLVTAGPGLTNVVTGMAGAWLESREVLVVGGQVKSSDLAPVGVRQMGIQELDGISLVSSICTITHRVTSKESYLGFLKKLSARHGRPGPIFVEWCLDAQAIPVTQFDRNELDSAASLNSQPNPFEVVEDVGKVSSMLDSATRPLVLIGSGLAREKFKSLLPELEALGIPLQFTWNAADYLPFDHPLNFGRPNTWGQLDANLILQQCDLLIAIGSRLGLQQTGFAWQEFAPLAQIVQIDIDASELDKGRPRVDLRVQADAFSFLVEMLQTLTKKSYTPWVAFAGVIREKTPHLTQMNSKRHGYIQPQEFLGEICELAPEDAALTPSSSGGTFTVSMQTMNLKSDQRLVSNKALASMGYGTAGSIGLALADRSKVAICVEGDGGFAQNLQELGTVAAQNLNIKFFIFANNGYASIRMTQRNYFDGSWIGCDSETGVGLPNLQRLAEAFGLGYEKLNSEDWRTAVTTVFSRPGPQIIEVPIDPEQTYLPKIGSRLNSDGTMTSNPLHQMDPPLPPSLLSELLVFRKNEIGVIGE